MSVTIKFYNINDFMKNKYNDITKITWHAGDLNKNVIDNFPNLLDLHCRLNGITSLESLSDCINLKELRCNSNNITSLEPLSKCINLKELRCKKNKIISLEPLSGCVNLKELRCKKNKIISLKPLSACVNLKKLYCHYNKIKSLKSLFNCVNLQYLDCGPNEITSLEPLSNCVNLQYLDCCYNKITSLKPLSKCINLQNLYCDYNDLASLEPLSKCINLQILICHHNKITFLEPLSKCVNLQYLDCKNNQITSLEPLSKCFNLQNLYCSNNKITSLEPLSNCVNLQYLVCSSNQIISLMPLIYHQRLIGFSYNNNPLDVQTMQVQRFLDRLDRNLYSSIYGDNQNVHDTTIQRTVCDSLKSLLSDPRPDFSIDNVINSDLDNKTKEAIIEYCQDQTVHSIHLITYEELLSYVWTRIVKSEHQTELKKILEEQIADAECMCFTGRFNRTLSVLVGFYDDIKINISDNSRISAIILNCKDKIVPYNEIIHQEMSKKELIEAGYNENEIESWISAITE